MFKKCLEHGEFSSRQRHALSIASEFPGGEIDFNVAKTERSVITGRSPGNYRNAATQHGLNSSDQFTWVERFWQIVVGAHFQPDDAIDFVPLGRQHDDGLLWVAGTDASTERQAVFAWKHEIEDDQVEGVATHQPIHGLAIFSGSHGKTLLAEITLQQFPQSFVVIDDKDFSVGHEEIPGRCGYFSDRARLASWANSIE